MIASSRHAANVQTLRVYVAGRGFAERGSGSLLDVAVGVVGERPAAWLVRPEGDAWQRNKAYRWARDAGNAPPVPMLKSEGRSPAAVAAELHAWIDRASGTARVEVVVLAGRRWLTAAPFHLPADHQVDGTGTTALDVVTHALEEATPAPPPAATTSAATSTAGSTTSTATSTTVPMAAPQDVYDFRGLLIEWGPRLAAQIQHQAQHEASSKARPRGEEPDDLLAATLAGLRALLLRFGAVPAAHDVVEAIHAAAAALPMAPGWRWPRPAPSLADGARVWLGEVLEPVGPTVIGPSAQPGVVYRRPSGELVALSRHDIARHTTTQEKSRG